MQRSVLVSIVVLGAVTLGCGTGDGHPPPPQPPNLTERVAPKPPGADDYASRSFAFPLSLADAEAILRQTQIFAFGGMSPKRQVQAFNVVFEQPDSASRFQLLAEAASAAGKLYALAGLLLLDPPAAGRLQRTLAAEPQPILVFDSDVVYEKPVSELAAMVERRDMGIWFRQVRDETIAHFAESR